MTAFFKKQHFELLRQWGGKPKRASSGESQVAYAELSNAYKVTETWAAEVRKRLFRDGRVRVLKKPTTQANKFATYNWARIYPTKHAPKQLAYTVGIDAAGLFVVKIDTVGVGFSSPIRKAYMEVRGESTGASPISAALPAERGLQMSMTELVDWSVAAIQKFEYTYTQVLEKLDLDGELSDEDLLNHFDGKLAFATFRRSWSDEEEALFCRLARAIHAAGLDWWHMGKGIQVRFGRKNSGEGRATEVVGIVRGTRARTINVAALGGVGAKNRAPLNEKLVAEIEAALAEGPHQISHLSADRLGLWPDQLEDDPSDTIELGDNEQLVDEESDAERLPAFNRIYYGPPGTGKTYALQQLLQTDYEQEASTVSSEQWRSQFIAENFAQLTWWHGIAAALYESGGSASVTEILEHPFVKAITAAKGRTLHVRQTIWAALQNHTREQSTTVKGSQRIAPLIFDKDADSIWHLVDDWRETCEDVMQLVDTYRSGGEELGLVKRYAFVTFHQSYGYEEFVEGLRPVLGSGTEVGEIQYEIRAGVFKDLCRKARLDPEARYAIVIDEINRGNISKIFGELITLIEIDKREGAEHELSVTLPYSGESFSVPSNVDIIGTMNTADRSLALLDIALRRRFDFVARMPDARDVPGAPLSELVVTAGDSVIDVPRMLQAMNLRIEALFDRDHCIGHAYFTPLKKLADQEERFIGLSQIFANRILPLLEEYFFEDWEKIHLVLADNQKGVDQRFVREAAGKGEDLTRLFGGEGATSAGLGKRRFFVQDSAFSDPEAYVGIYKSLL